MAVNDLKAFAEPYSRAQHAIAELKPSAYSVLATGPEQGLTNAELGRTLGVYQGHVGHEGHIPRTILAIMEQEGVVEQDPTSKRWRLRGHIGASESD